MAATQVKVGQTAAFYLEASVVNSFQCRTGEYSVSENSVDLRGPGLEQLVGGLDYGAAGVGHVVHQDGHPVLEDGGQVGVGGDSFSLTLASPTRTILSTSLAFFLSL